MTWHMMLISMLWWSLVLDLVPVLTSENNSKDKSKYFSTKIPIIQAASRYDKKLLLSRSNIILG